MILDLDGTGGRGRTRRHLSWILPLAAAAVALALVAAVNAVPHETTTREAAATPRVDTLSRATPVPKLNLTLPQDLAVLTARAQYTGETGLLRPDAVVVTYRLRAGITWHDGTPFTAEDMACLNHTGAIHDCWVQRPGNRTGRR